MAFTQVSIQLKAWFMFDKESVECAPLGEYFVFHEFRDFQDRERMHPETQLSHCIVGAGGIRVESAPCQARGVTGARPTYMYLRMYNLLFARVCVHVFLISLPVVARAHNVYVYSHSFSCL